MTHIPLLLRSSLYLILIGILAFILVISIGNLFIFNKKDQYIPSDNADAVIILGAHVGGVPLRPSYMLQYRLDKAVEYWQKNPSTMIVTTGGKTAGHSHSEAEVMKQYLIDQGIPSTQILLEDLSTRTAHQFINSHKVLQNAGKKADKIVVITNDFHLPRAMMLAKRSGLKEVSGLASQTPKDSRSKITAHIREPMAILFALLFDYPQL